jgi:death on curing protein
MNEPKWLNINDIITFHREILAISGGEEGILNLGALESTLNNPKNSLFYNSDSTLYDLAASYAYGFVKNHCFVDGNKRISLIATYTFLYINGIELMATEIDAANFFLELAQVCEPQDTTKENVKKWLLSNSANI